jgi:hypothetical protein
VSLWVVTVATADWGTRAYGPIDDHDDAASFADFMSAEVNPASVIELESPTGMVLRAWANAKRSPEHRPSNWPPKPAEIWSDNTDRRWIATASNYLTLIVFAPAKTGRGGDADEVWRLHGPLKFVGRADLAVHSTFDEEPPF